MDKNFPLLGIDIGGTKVALCLGTSDGKIISTSRVPNRFRSPEDVVPEIISEGRRLVKEAGLEGKLAAVGIDSPSPMDFDNGVILEPHNLPMWKNVPICKLISAGFGVPAYIDNDANAAGLAEWIFGAGQGTKNMIYLTMSTGIGAGIIASGRLLRGANCYGGEVGHMVIDVNGPECTCGMHGCYEAFCGGLAITTRLREEFAAKPDSVIMKMVGGEVEKIDIPVLREAVKAGDGRSCEIWSDMMERNAQAMGMLVNAFNPEVIALGTIAIHSGDLFMKPLLERIVKYCWKEPLAKCSFTASKMGAMAGEYAALAVAIYSLYERGKIGLPEIR